MDQGMGNLSEELYFFHFWKSPVNLMAQDRVLSKYPQASISLMIFAPVFSTSTFSCARLLKVVMREMHCQIGISEQKAYGQVNLYLYTLDRLRDIGNEFSLPSRKVFSGLSPLFPVLSGARNGQELRSLLCSNLPSKNRNGQFQRKKGPKSAVTKYETADYI